MMTENEMSKASKITEPNRNRTSCPQYNMPVYCFSWQDIMPSLHD